MSSSRMNSDSLWGGTVQINKSTIQRGFLEEASRRFVLRQAALMSRDLGEVKLGEPAEQYISENTTPFNKTVLFK